MAYIAHSENEKNVKEFGDSVMELAINPAGGQGGITDKLADVLVQTQRESLNVVMASPQFSKLRAKTDPDVIVFVATMDATKEVLNSPATAEKIKKELAAKSDAATSVLTFDMLRKQVPALQWVSDYFWLLLSLGNAMMFLFIANLFLSKLAGLFAAVFRALFESVEATFPEIP